MKKKIKFALLGAGILLSGVGAYLTSGKYGVQDNSMVLANVEA